MTYFVTGATGFIGSRLVKKLLDRGGVVYFLVRDAKHKKLPELYERWGVDKKRAIPVVGDLTKKRLGVSKANMAKIKGNVKHFFHLAAIYDLSSPHDVQHKINVEGTENTIDLATHIGAKCFHFASSIAAAGLYDGVFREDMFDEATGLEHPYFRTKHDSEGTVRMDCSIPYRIYRPGIVVGDSQTGEMDKIDGPYYFFKLIQKMRRSLPRWMPTIGVEGGRLNIVPVDFVVDAMDHIAHKKGLDGGCFHLVDPDPKRVGDVMNTLARAAHAPEMALRLNMRMFGFIPPYVWKTVAAAPPIRRMLRSVMEDLGLPDGVLKFINFPTRYDNRETEAALKGSGISVPDLDSYAWRLWDYWERHMDPELFKKKTLEDRVRNKVVVVTGASSGIGKSVALQLGAAGANVVLVARGKEKLEETQAQIVEEGGQAAMYSADLAEEKSIDKLLRNIYKDFKRVDILVNNAGRSIRRSISSSYDRFHDFERTMQLNYFGSLRLIMGLLPGMADRKKGHIINISSIGVLSNAPRFSAYVASKAALDAFTRCAGAEFKHEDIHFTTVNMPLVRTPMIAPTKIYDNVPTISPGEAATMITDAIITRPIRVATRLGIFAEISHLLFPKVTQVGMSSAFQMFPDSAASKGEKGAQQPSPEQIALAQITKGIHW
ncbi:MAG: SDR family oxidoreductase [Pseudomonadota bacterium]